jgi:hypothetical protein
MDSENELNILFDIFQMLHSVEEDMNFEGEHDAFSLVDILQILETLENLDNTEYSHPREMYSLEIPQETHEKKLWKLGDSALRGVIKKASVSKTSQRTIDALGQIINTEISKILKTSLRVRGDSKVLTKDHLVVGLSILGKNITK